MPPNAPTLLRAILAVIQNDLAPLLTSPYASHRLELVKMVLLRLVAEMEPGSEIACWQESLGGLAAAMPDMASVPQPLRDALEGASRECKSGEARLRDLTARLAEALAATRASSASHRAGVAAAIREMASAEYRARSAIEATILADDTRARSQQSSSEELVVSEDVLTRYLARRFPDRPGLRAVNVARVPGGRSKGTILFDLVTAEGSQPLVIRKDFSKDFMGYTVADEYPLLRAVWKAGLPVPEPHWLEEDASILRGKFIVFSRLPGRPAGTMFDVNTSPAVVRAFAATLGRLHSLDLTGICVARHLKFGSSDFAVKDMVQASYATHRAQTPGNLLLEAGHHWLFTHLDCIPRQPALVHGDAGFHNLLADGDRMTALLDWELAHAGDPAEDLTSCQALAETVIPWEEFMAAYVENGGKSVSEDRLRFFSIWKLIRNSMFADSARRMFESGVDRDLRLATVGYNTFSKLQHGLAKELALAPVS